MGNVIKSHFPAEKQAGPDHSDALLKATDFDNLVVLSDYPCRDISEPIFRMGERLKGLCQEGCWWRVLSLDKGTENYIPNNHVAKVYHGWLFEGVVRQKAEQLLRLPGNTVGSFLIRESPTQRGTYSLSVRHRAIMHYKIFRLANNWFYISPSLTFQCLEDMVNHYSDCQEGICCVLLAPCLALPSTTPSSISQAPPVVMRRNFDWKKVDQSQLVDLVDQNCAENKHNMVSYGVRNSIASYLSIAGTGEQAPEIHRSKKSRSVYVMPQSNNMETAEDN